MVEAEGDIKIDWNHTGRGTAGSTMEVSGLGWGSGRRGLKMREADGNREKGDAQVEK